MLGNIIEFINVYVKIKQWDVIKMCNLYWLQFFTLFQTTYQYEKIIYFNNKINVILTKGDRVTSTKLYFTYYFDFHYKYFKHSKCKLLQLQQRPLFKKWLSRLLICEMQMSSYIHKLKSYITTYLDHEYVLVTTSFYLNLQLVQNHWSTLL